MTALLIAWLLVAVVWLVSVLVLRVERQWHHFHIGFVLAVLGLALAHRLPTPTIVVAFLAYRLPSPGLVLAWLGLLIAADDAWQHAFQWLARRRYYRSPLHELYRALYPRLPKWARL